MVSKIHTKKITKRSLKNTLHTNLTGQEREAPVHVRCGYNVVRMDAFLYAGVRINNKVHACPGSCKDEPCVGMNRQEGVHLDIVFYVSV